MKAKAIPEKVSAVMPALGADRCPKDQSIMRTTVVEHCIEYSCLKCGYTCKETNSEMRLQFESIRRSA